MSTATSGRAREYRVRNHMINAGWRLVMRSAGSKGAADLAMVHDYHGLALVQVGTANKRLRPADRERLLEVAGPCGALPIVASVMAGIGIRYWLVTPDAPGKWTEWQP